MIVKAGEREEFLTPWVRKLIGQKKEAGLKGTKHLARLLNRSTVFEKDKNEKGFISVESLNTEIIKLRKALLNEQKEDGKERNRTGRFCKIVVFAPFPHEKAQSHLKYYPFFCAAIRQTKTIKN